MGLRYACIFAALLALSTLSCAHSVKRSPSSNYSIRQFPLDVHVHVEDGHGYENALKNRALAHSFLLSPSYSITSSSQFFTEKYKVENDFLARDLVHAETSAIVAKYPLSFTGFCGLNLSWNDGPEVIKKCLSMPGMHGIKIHDLSESARLNLTEKFKNLEAVLQALDNQHIIILWHIRSDPGTDRELLSKQLDGLLNVVFKNKQMAFIIAHALDSLDDTSHLAILDGKLSQLKSRPTNLFLELSATTDICDSKPNPGTIELWRKFGIDYILLGSDSTSRSWPSEWLLAETASAIKTSASLTESDKIKILKWNELNFLKTYLPLVFLEIKNNFLIEPNINDIRSFSCEELKTYVRSAPR